MSITRRSGSVSAITIVLALALAVSALALAGCGPEMVSTSGSPGGPSGTGQSEEQVALQVGESDKPAITEALTAAGITGDALYISMNYESPAKDTVIVTGELKNKDGAAVTRVVVKKSGDKWAVAQ